MLALFPITIKPFFSMLKITLTQWNLMNELNEKDAFGYSLQRLCVRFFLHHF